MKMVRLLLLGGLLLATSFTSHAKPLCTTASCDAICGAGFGRCVNNTCFCT